MPAKPDLRIVLCSPRGFCAGVVRAIDTVERALTIYGAPVYVRHEIVHNRYVVDSLKTKGAIFVEELAEIPDNTNAPVVDALIVVGAPNSSNSQRLREVAEREGCPIAVLAQRASDLDWSRFDGIRTLGITAGASAPEVIVEEIMGAFAERYELHVETVSAAEENEFFPLPRSLRPDAA